MTRTVKIVQTLESEFVIEFESGYTLNIPKEEFEYVFEKVDDTNYKIKEEIDKKTDAQMEELQEICFYSLASREYEHTDNYDNCIKAFVKVTQLFCSKHLISQNVFFSALKTLECQIIRSLINLGIHFDLTKHPVPKDLVEANDTNTKSLKDVLEKRFNG